MRVNHLPRIRVAVDIGGTFTDVVVFDESSAALWAAKVSTTPANFADGVLAAIHAGKIDPADVVAFIHGTTVVINAITERSGAKTALVTTAGFRDVLEIGRGNRPDMYNLLYHKPPPFVPRDLRFEVREPIDWRGCVLEPPHLDDLDPIVVACREQGVEAIAICLLHAYAHPEHEERCRDFLQQRLPGVAVATSSSITREWREFERTSTAVLNAYVQPVVDRYLGELEAGLAGKGYKGGLSVMQSNGGTASFAMARQLPLHLIESGPVAGITGAARVGELL